MTCFDLTTAEEAAYDAPFRAQYDGNETLLVAPGPERLSPEPVIARYRVFLTEEPDGIPAHRAMLCVRWSVGPAFLWTI